MGSRLSRACCSALAASALLSPLAAQEGIPSLARSLAGYFAVGAAVQPGFVEASDRHYGLLTGQFSAVVAENAMKPEALQPLEGIFRFRDADKIARFAESEGMALRGHTLVWHRQTPLWFFLDPDDPRKPASRELLLSRMRVHIQTVVGHFRGRVAAWDVVNEVLSDDGALRSAAEGSKWLEIIGPDYIDKAFEYAREADPAALLVINDYNLESSASKREAMYALVKGLLARGAPVGAVGLQMHVSIASPSIGDIRRAIERFASLGLKVQVTELDVSIYQGSEGAKPVTAELLDRQARRYAELFGLFKEEAAAGRLDMVMLWGVSDDASWLDSFPVPGRANAPLLFDRRQLPKPAFWAIVGL
jgi:endo-1,4-beta-xylanase